MKGSTTGRERSREMSDVGRVEGAWWERAVVVAWEGSGVSRSGSVGDFSRSTFWSVDSWLIELLLECEGG